ncbi:hypothetical protein Ddc_10777 [Ditylenchus destructor]|nr:hypothetical protein Ddc_10777 [Ditylenchus destructor]
MSRVDGLHDSFHICHPKGYNAVDEMRIAYFIGGRSDPALVENFIHQTAHDIKIRIFTEVANQSQQFKVNLIKEYKGNVRFGPLSLHKTGFADVKTIIDLRGDNHRLEIIKYDLSYTDVEPIIMSITTPVPICQLLIVLRDKSVAQVARLIKNLNAALYYIYAANRSPHKRNIYYLSFMRFSCGTDYDPQSTFRQRKTLDGKQGAYNKNVVLDGKRRPRRKIQCDCTHCAYNQRRRRRKTPRSTFSVDVLIVREALVVINGLIGSFSIETVLPFILSMDVMQIFDSKDNNLSNDQMASGQAGAATQKFVIICFGKNYRRQAS